MDEPAWLKRVSEAGWHFEAGLLELESALDAADELDLSRSEYARYQSYVDLATIGRALQRQIPLFPVGGDEPVTGDPRFLARYAADARTWRDAWLRVVTHHAALRAGAPDRGADTYEAWEDDTVVIAAIAAGCTADFIRFAEGELNDMADYLAEQVPVSRCPEHAEWAEGIRSWTRLWRNVATHQAEHSVAGTVDRWTCLCFSESFQSLCAQRMSLELAAVTVVRMGGIAEFFSAEARAAAPRFALP